MARKLIFSTPATAGIASRLLFNCDRFELGAITWRAFQDGTPRLMIENIDAINNRDVVFLAAFERQEDYFTQYSAMYEIALAGPSTFTIVLPYFPTATMERPEPHGTVVTAKTLAAMLSTLPPARSGITELVIFDPHTEVLKSFFDPHKVRVTFQSFMPFLAREGFSDTVVFPDKGARERFGRFFSERRTVACEKVRYSDRTAVSIHPGYEPNILNMSCVIVDDLMQSGGTLIECAARLRELGAFEVNCAFTHAVCPDESWRKLEGVFNAVITTNSCPATEQAIAKCGSTTFVIRDMSSLIAGII